MLPRVAHRHQPAQRAEFGRAGARRNEFVAEQPGSVRVHARSQFRGWFCSGMIAPGRGSKRMECVPQLRPLVASFVPECTTNGLSVIATPVDEPSTLAGALICRDFKSPLPVSH
jgi:hypothetical protein